ncbi:MAG TPA: flagellar hook assembly protein FlgD [Burkholderiaceae bacterium]|nr:flagellar hook assembly protein FlgD [Burkholderiaceae bacterium]
MTTITDNSVSSSLMAAMNPKQATAKSEAVEAQDRFMKLLVTQMKNQDPLNPLDNAQMTSQLAQLSTVTGIDKLNTTIESLTSSFQTGQSLQAASMIGHAVMVPGSNITLAEGKALLGLELAEPADNVKVAIRDAAGKVVHTMDLGSREVGAWPLAWDGKTDAGVAAADGQYTFDITATRGGQKISATALAFGEVGSVSAGTQGVKLNVTNVGAVNLADVRQIL